MAEKGVVIGVTGPDRGGTPAWWFTSLAIWRAGGRARRVTPSRPVPIDELDGLVIGGGADVDPGLYGEEHENFLAELKESRRPFLRSLGRLLFFPLLFLVRRFLSIKAAVKPDHDRDALETRLLKGALRKGMPVLGICRGAQLLNIVAGGSLHQHLREFYVETPQIRTILPKMEVSIEPGSKLAAILGTLRCTVNALHRQAVNELGENLTVAAREANGVIQAIEAPGRPFCIGLQWHPEYLPQQREQLSIFKGLVAAARNGRN